MYIKKEETLAKLKELRCRWGSTLTARGINGAIEVVENMEEVNAPDINVGHNTPAPTPTTTSYWEETEIVSTSKNGRETRSKDYTCANCKTSNGKKKTNQCPECGAKMDGERREQNDKTE